MSKKAGALLWNRQRVTVPAATNGGPPGTLDVDTGLTQENKAFAGMSLNEPTFGNPSRIQVVPLSPIPAWATLTHGEPFFNTTTGTIHVVFSNAAGAATINVLFWDPHSIVGPGVAVTYNPIT
jgi:hypothetical protein